MKVTKADVERYKRLAEASPGVISAAMSTIIAKYTPGPPSAEAIQSFHEAVLSGEYEGELEFVVAQDRFAVGDTIVQPPQAVAPMATSVSMAQLAQQYAREFIAVDVQELVKQAVDLFGWKGFLPDEVLATIVRAQDAAALSKADRKKDIVHLAVLATVVGNNLHKLSDKKDRYGEDAAKQADVLIRRYGIRKPGGTDALKSGSVTPVRVALIFPHVALFALMSEKRPSVLGAFFYHATAVQGVKKEFFQSLAASSQYVLGVLPTDTPKELARAFLRAVYIESCFFTSSIKASQLAQMSEAQAKASKVKAWTAQDATAQLGFVRIAAQNGNLIDVDRKAIKNLVVGDQVDSLALAAAMEQDIDVVLGRADLPVGLVDNLPAVGSIGLAFKEMRATFL